jgi:hypothetical protein
MGDGGLINRCIPLDAVSGDRRRDQQGTAFHEGNPPAVSQVMDLPLTTRTDQYLDASVVGTDEGVSTPGGNPGQLELFAGGGI